MQERSFTKISPAKLRGSVGLLLLSLVGMLLGAYLLKIHVEVTALGETSKSFCNLGKFFNCNIAAKSNLSVFWGVPLANLGLAFYLAIFMTVLWDLLSRYLEPPRPSEFTSGFILTLFTFNAIGSVILGGLSVLTLKSLCPGCFGLYLVSIVGLTISWFWHGASPYHFWKSISWEMIKFVKSMATLAPATLRGRLFKGLAEVLSVFLFSGVVFLGIAGGKWWTAKSLKELSLKNLEARSANFLQEIFFKAPKVSNEVLRRPHAPFLGAATAKVVLVTFSDFECGYCAKFARILEEVRTSFKDELRVEFRNFPLSFHEHALLAAKMGLCASQKGLFWPLHDLMFQRQDSLSPKGLADLVKQVGLDPVFMQQCSQSTEIEALIAQDLQDGEAAGLTGTPVFFINGRRFIGVYNAQQLREFLNLAFKETR